MVARIVNWLLGNGIRLMPDALFAAVLPSRYRYRPSDVPPPPIPPRAETRLYIAPVNWAGQGWEWARAAERNLDSVGAVTMAYHLGTEYGHPVDQSVPVGAYLGSSRWQGEQRDAVVAGFSHVLVEAGRHPFGRIFDQTVASQVRGLIREGLAVGLLFHGSDIRLPSRNAELQQDSPFRDSMWSRTPKLQREAVRNRALLDELNVPVFVSTPDLLLDVPTAAWLPVVIDPQRWATDAIPLTRERPIVAHAPSRSVAKGSDLIDPIMRRLDDEGVVTYLRVEGVPAAEMETVYRDADIVLDQFRVGDFGVAACEAMAAGRTVVAHVSETSRAFVRTATGFELPIVEARAQDLEEVILRILAQRESYRERAAAGVEYARAVHDGRRSAEVLREFLTPHKR